MRARKPGNIGVESEKDRKKESQRERERERERGGKEQ